MAQELLLKDQVREGVIHVAAGVAAHLAHEGEEPLRSAELTYCFEGFFEVVVHLASTIATRNSGKF